MATTSELRRSAEAYVDAQLKSFEDAKVSRKVKPREREAFIKTAIKAASAGAKLKGKPKL